MLSVGVGVVTEVKQWTYIYHVSVYVCTHVQVTLLRMPQNPSVRLLFICALEQRSFVTEPFQITVCLTDFYGSIFTSERPYAQKVEGLGL